MIKESIGYGGDIVFDTTKLDGDPIKIMSGDNFINKFKDFDFYDHKSGIQKTVEYYEDVLK